MAASDTHICNLALGQIGAGRIADIQGTTQVERDCATVYADARDAVLADFDWGFARRQAVLARLAIVPEFRYAYAFQLPSDFIEVRRLSVPKLGYEIVGDQLYCNVKDCKIVYTRREDDPVKYPAKFTEAFVHRLSAVLASTVKKNSELATSWWGTYYSTLSVLESRTNGGENMTELEANPYVNARHGASFVLGEE